jgi:hypothetical protein
MNAGSRVGPAFDAAKLDRIVAAYERQGGTVIRGDAAVGILKNNGANALYFPVEGGPGALFLGPNATRLEVVEELMHLGQYRKLGWPSGQGGLRLQVELDAQENLLNLAAKQNWTSAETYRIPRNQTVWMNEAGK